MQYAKSQYDQAMKAQGVLDHLRVELDTLMNMGDTVRPEDVIEAAGRLVGHGLGASQLAQIMSDMPAMGGEGLASWVRMHDNTISQAEQQLSLQTRVLQHNMGIAATTAMAATHMESRMRQSGVPSVPPASVDMTPPRGRPPNALMPDGGGEDQGDMGGMSG
jgi:hypothetical protein